MTINQLGLGKFRDPGTQDLHTRYLLGEVCDADAREIENERRADPDFNHDMTELQLLTALVEAIDPDVLDEPSPTPPEAEMTSSPVAPLVLDDGATIYDPDRDVVRTEDGVSAAAFVCRLESAGWARIRQIGQDYRSFQDPKSEFRFLFPFSDDAWLGPKVQAKYRQLIEEPRGSA